LIRRSGLASASAKQRRLPSRSLLLVAAAILPADQANAKQPDQERTAAEDEQ
jgi:hypothetical protein